MRGGQCRSHRVGGIGLAALAARLPVRPDHLDPPQRATRLDEAIVAECCALGEQTVSDLAVPL